MNRQVLSAILLGGISVLALAQGPNDTLPKTSASDQLATLLGWVEVPNDGGACSGHFSNLKPPKPQMHQPTASISLKADTGLFAQKADAHLAGHIQVQQGQHLITADYAKIHQAKADRSPTTVTLLGSIKAIGPSGMLLAHKGIAYLSKPKHLSIFDAAYRLSDPKDILSSLPGWGRAASIDGNDLGQWVLHQASYSTCAPTHPSWALHASALSIDHATGWGEAKHAVLFIHQAPVFYFPYLKFPIDGRRHSGFLTPILTFYSGNEQRMSLPYYWNIQSNLDAELTPIYDNKRGYGLETLWRYLTSHGHGRIATGVLPDDRIFDRFKHGGASAQFGGQPYTDAGLNQLAHFPTTRWYGAWQDDHIWSPALSSHVNIQRVSDSYLLADFGELQGLDHTGRLPGALQLNVDQPGWQASFLIQDIQTLHPVTQPRIADVYSRLPQLTWQGWRNIGPVETKALVQLTRFWRPKEFYTGLAVPTGQRLNAQIEASVHREFGAGDWQASLDLRHARYVINDQPDGLQGSPQYTVPIVRLGGHLVFQRPVKYAGSAYRQTLEPRIQYLYAPAVQQSDIPLFDTSLPIYTELQLFRLNRFSGADRVGDANQISLGLTSRLLAPASGLEHLRFDIGQTYALRLHAVCLSSDCRYDLLARQHRSPLTVSLQMQGVSHWQLYAGSAIDVNEKALFTTDVGLRYAPDPRRQMTLSYHYVRTHFELDQKTPLPEAQARVNQYQLAFAWPMGNNWQVLADSLFDAGVDHAHSYFVGLAYHSCCWSLRLMTGRDFAGIDGAQTRMYHTRTYLQFQLSGLMGVGSTGAHEWLHNALPTYDDPFK